MKVVMSLSLRRARVRTALMALGAALFVWVVGLSYASVDQNAIRSLVESLPPMLKVLTGATGLASPAGYLGSAFMHPVALSVIGATVISMATHPARDRATGVAEMMLSRPLAPWRWLAGNAIAMYVCLVVVVSAGVLGALVSIATVDDLRSVSTRSLMMVAVNLLAVFGCFAAIALLFSVQARSGGQAVGWSAGFVVLSYALNYLAQVWSLIRPLGVLSVFHRFDPGLVLRTGHLPTSVVVTLCVVTLIATVGAHILVERQEPVGNR